MLSLETVPPELIEELILHLDPIDVALISQCSRFFRALVYNPQEFRLWRQLYLRQPFDDPRKCVSLLGMSRTRIDWAGDLQRLIRARTVLYNPALSRPGERATTLRTLIELQSHVPPLRSDKDTSISRNLVWIAAALRGGVFIDAITTDPDVTEEEKQLCSRLHTSFGLTHLDTRSETRVRTRGFVYDLRNYTGENVYGPYDSRGRVNWLHVQALHHVVSMHIVDLEDDETFEFAIFPMSILFTQPVIPPGIDLDVEEDWAGVAGEWRVSFCFCDHTELLKYNDSDIGDGTLDSSIFAAPDFGEVFRSLDFTFRVTSTIPNDDFPTRPTLCFLGEMQGATATMRGRVSIRPDGQIQWYFVSGDHGHVVWSSQGIQIGGIRSSFGVLGAWTTVFHDMDDPVGPFWLRRKSVTEGMPMNHISQNS